MNSAECRVILRDYITARDVEMVAYVTCRPGSVPIHRESLLSEIEDAMACGVTDKMASELDRAHRYIMYCDLDS